MSAVVTEKQCTICEETKPAGEFYAHATNKDRLHSYCKSCHSARSREREKMRWSADPAYRERVLKKRNSPEGRRRQRSYRLKHRYGITLEEYERLLDQQEGVCAICAADDPGDNRTEHFHVDHCHETGEVRGLLCINCNRAVGCFKNDPEIMASAIRYLRQ